LPDSVGIFFESSSYFPPYRKKLKIMKGIIYVGLLFIIVNMAKVQSKVTLIGYVPDETSGEDFIGALIN
jgi:hypothetical protein